MDKLSEKNMQKWLWIIGLILILVIGTIGTYYLTNDNCGINGWNSLVCFSKIVAPELWTGIAAGFVIVILTKSAENVFEEKRTNK